MSRWGPQLAEGTKCRRPFGQAFEYWMTQEASRLLQVNYAVSQGTVFQAIPGRSLSWLPRVPPQMKVELHVGEICLVACQPAGSFICLLLIVIILEQQSQKLYFKAEGNSSTKTSWETSNLYLLFRREFPRSLVAS